MRDLRKVKNKYEFRLDNRQLALLFAGGLLIFVLLFTLGVMVGRDWREWEQSRELAVSSQQPELAQVEEEVVLPKLEEATPKDELSKKSISSSAEIASSPESPKEVEYTFYETLPQKEPAKMELEAPPGKKEKEEEKKIVKKPSPKEEPATTQPPLTAEGKYTVQVSSFTEREKATELVARLIKKKYPAYITSTQISQTTWYRVRIGRFASREEAEKFALTLKEKEKLNTFVTPITK
jgi:DedD protein